MKFLLDGNQSHRDNEFPSTRPSIPLRVLICAGGTGGGVYPALAVLQTLQPMIAEVPDLVDAESELQSLPGGTQGNSSAASHIHWVGSEKGIEIDLLEKAGIPVETISAGQVHGVGLKAISSFLQLARGYFQSRRILRRFQPEVMFFTGGYLAVPMALAGRRFLNQLSVPSLLYVPDIEPGLALKILARFADCIAITAEASRAYFSPRAHLELTGYPVRSEVLKWCSLPLSDRTIARQSLGLSAELPVLLVFGGSKGARSINLALLDVLPELLSDMQVLHISGNLDWPQVEAALNILPHRLSDASWTQRYHPFPYLHDEMGAALASADLVLSRAGASTLGEFTALGLPAILVPYPHAWRYQQINAQYLEHYGAALIIRDADLSQQLLPVVRKLMDDTAQREKMHQAMLSLAHPEAAHTIAKLLHHVAGKPYTGGGAVKVDLYQQEGTTP